MYYKLQNAAPIYTKEIQSVRDWSSLFPKSLGNSQKNDFMNAATKDYLSVAVTAGKGSVFGVFLVRIFPCSVRMRENADQKNSD